LGGRSGEIMKQLATKATGATKKLEPYCDLEWHEVAKAIFQAKGIETGLWRVAVRLQFNPTTFRWLEPDDTLVGYPTAMVAIKSLALFPADKLAAMVFDAADPQPTPRERRPPKPSEVVATKSPGRARKAAKAK
jgi:hypothetical protein